jgi:hypothetical protein
MEGSECPKKSLHSFKNSMWLRQWHLKTSLAVFSSLCGNYQKRPQACSSNDIQTKKPFWVELDWIGFDLERLPQSHWSLRTHEGFKSKLETNSDEQNVCFNTILVTIARLGVFATFPIGDQFPYLSTYSLAWFSSAQHIPQLYHTMWARTGLISVRSSHNLNPLPKSQIPADDWLPNLIQLTKGMYQQSSTFKIQIKWIWSTSSALGNSQLGTIHVTAEDNIVFV